MFSFFQSAYNYKWATKADLKKAVVAQLITADEYKTITGEDYSA
jgi:uncharacterized XkdX family phage protein